jgi:hypothetical protein
MLPEVDERFSPTMTLADMSTPAKRFACRLPRGRLVAPACRVSLPRFTADGSGGAATPGAGLARIGRFDG